MRPAARLSALVASALLTLTPAAGAQVTATLTTLYSFTGAGTDGEFPSTTLVTGSDGSLCGTTEYGGGNGDGTVFSFLPGSVPGILHSFADGALDGKNPDAGLVLGSDGDLYGTSPGGGSSSDGTVFKVTPAGVFTLLHSFAGAGTDGISPAAALVEGSDGNFYGTTTAGGSSGNGTVFMMTPAGVVSILHSFVGDATDGGDPLGSLVQGGDGTFYGTASTSGPGGHGTVFSVTPAGVYATLYGFTAAGSDGGTPEASLIVGQDGNLYGTTFYGGVSSAGTVFSVTPAGVHTTLFSFSGGQDGGNPQCALVQDSDGNFYGTAVTGGSANDGTVFQVTPAGVITTLHSFGSGGTDGVNPRAGMVRGGDGNFYGTTFYGGSSNAGTIFRLALAPAVGTLQFTTASDNTTENAGSVTLTVQRTGGSAGAVSVDYTETDGTAFAGLDYQVMSGVLTWADGDATDKTITIPINDRGLSNGGTVSFSVGLTNASGGATLGTIPTATVNILDDDTASAPTPTLAIVSPPDGITVTVGEAVPLAASVVDPGGVLAQVQFSVNGVVVATTGASGPFATTAAAPAPGTYVLGAVATDKLGRTSTQTVAITVIAADPLNPPPTVALLTPVADRSLAAGSTVTLSFTAAPAPSTGLAQVSLYADGALVTAFDGNGNPLGTGTGRPIRRDAVTSVGNVFQTAYTLPGVDKLVDLIVVALDKLGRSTVSTVTTVHSTATAELSPLVALGGLSDGARVAVGSPETVTVTASDPNVSTQAAGVSRGHGVVRVDASTAASTLALLEYYLNGVRLGQATRPPYTFAFTPPTAGNYVLNAVATDTTGLATVSAPITVVAAAAPTVNLAIGGTGAAVEGGANGVIVVTRSGDTSQPLTVSYKAKGAARAGVEYKKLPGVVTIPAGAVKAKIKIKPVNGSPNASTLKIKVQLLAPTDGSYVIGTGLVKIKLIGD